MSGYWSGSGLTQRAPDWFLSGTGIMWCIDGVPPCTKVNLFHEFFISKTQWNLSEITNICITIYRHVYVSYMSSYILICISILDSYGQYLAVSLQCHFEWVPVWNRSDAESIRLVPIRYWRHLAYQWVTAGYWGQSVSWVYMNNALSVYLYHLYLSTSKWWSHCIATALWAGIGLEAVWCRTHLTGSFPVLASCSVLTGYHHVLRPIPFMSFH